MFWLGLGVGIVIAYGSVAFLVWYAIRTLNKSRGVS